jgi:F-type H+-transporting ATPase subunit delta
MVCQGVKSMQKIAQRYAKALFSSASSKNALDSCFKSLGTLETYLSESPAFKFLTRNLLVTPATQDKVLMALVRKSPLDLLVTNCVRLLIQARRLRILPEVIAGFSQLYNQSHNTAIAHVESACPLTQPLITQFQNILEECFKQKLIMKQTVNSDLLAGFRVKIGSYLIDSSLKTQLFNLSQRMKGA